MRNQEDSIGVIELKSMAKGMDALNELTKNYEVNIHLAKAICPGRYLILYTGVVGQIKQSEDFFKEQYKKEIIKTTAIFRVSPQIIHRLNRKQHIVGTLSAIGIVEVNSTVGLIKLCDTALKASAVELLEIKVTIGMAGKGYFLVNGEVGNVTTAIETVKQSSQMHKYSVNCTTISSPSEQFLQQVIGVKMKKDN
ncbi:hypothetical protein DOK67_0002872 [Enterococcus sp. DIV0212c]|uniref:BMC domain-containing protein n=1 Tax=Enterococcus sp. DIV0212c TaxID=2230867 RepID=UPI001A9B324C|nr:BMC domain-containing protein [Enterococcus sp. DIV0212c]MBO1354400.1 BMC domain-containing protein [Enterococcus sp. DIV0212c]